MPEITELLIQKLKYDVQYWQQKAIAASKANDAEGCSKALKAQAQEIDNLIKIAEAAKIQDS